MYRSGAFVIDPFRFEVRCDDRVASLEPKVMQVLVYLLERPGVVVSKEELLREVWEGRYVTDEVVTAAVYQIRKTLGDSATESAYLETVRRRGYLWRARVAELPATRRARGWKWALAAGMVMVSVAMLRSGPQLPRSAGIAYDKGRYFLDRRTPEAMHLARRSFEEAVADAPSWAPARAGLADSMMLMIDLEMGRAEELELAARRSVAIARELDQRSAEAWTSVALARLLLDFDLDSAEKGFLAALELDPEYFFAHQTYAWLLSAQGRLGEAIEEIRIASELAPTFTSPHLDGAFILNLAGRHEEAVREIESALQLDGSRPHGYAALGFAHAAAGHEIEGYSALKTFLELAHPRESVSDELARRFEREGLDGLYRFWLETRAEQMGWTARARLHAVLGETDSALDCLEEAYRRRDTAVLWVRSDPAFKPLERHPRFRELLRALL